MNNKIFQIFGLNFELIKDFDFRKMASREGYQIAGSDLVSEDEYIDVDISDSDTEVDVMDNYEGSSETGQGLSNDDQEGLNLITNKQGIDKDSKAKQQKMVSVVIIYSFTS